MKPTQNKEHEILEAAEREFLEKGFDGARTTSIAASAGVTPAMLHYYFRTKEAIFERILDEKIRLMGASLLSVFGREDLPLFERLKEGLTRHFDFLADNPGLPRFVVNEVFSKPQRYASMHRRLQPIVDRLVGGLQRDIDALAALGRIERLDARDLTLDILSLNMFPFLAYPFAGSLFSNDNDDKTFFERRKQENIEMLKRRFVKL